MDHQKSFPGAPYFRGIGQIMLQGNTLTGILFLAGIFYDGYLMGIAALLSAVIGTLTAKLLRYDAEEIRTGLYGFSATLVGVALTFYFKPLLVIWLAIIIGSALAAVLQHLLIKKNIPGFTFPFILVTWACLYLFQHVHIVPPALVSNTTLSVTPDFMIALHGYGEVIFQGSLLAGLLFFLGVFINTPVAALYGVVGAILSAYLCFLFGAPIDDILIGLYSFNAVLCAITFAGTTLRDGMYVLTAVVLAVAINMGMVKWQIPVLTFPFVLASFITTYLKRLFH
jgi:urea transporter